jgi:uncharacterized protein (TIGR02147 family)
MGIENRDVSSTPNSRSPNNGAYRSFEVDQFKMISDWCHLAILSLAKVRQNKADPAWIANHLGITKIESTDAIERLIRLGLIALKGSGFVRTTQPLFVHGNAPSSAIRKYHRQNLEKALDSLERDPIGVRDFTSMTMAIDPKKIEDARTMTKEFLEKMAAFLEEGDQRSVYTLAIQLFPVMNTSGGLE